MNAQEIIADVGANHMGNMDVAVAMIQACAAAGVDTVKFQSWQAKALRSDFPDYGATFARHSRAELSDDDHRLLIDACKAAGVEFLTTCFHASRIEFLASLGLKRIKVASPDCGNIGFLTELADAFDQVIISTGMTPVEEIEQTLSWAEGRNVIFLHCVSLYPTPLDKVNLAKMLTLAERGFAAGLSDHSLGTDAAKLALALGARIVEKHVTFSRSLPGKDQAMSTTPEEFAEIARWRDLVPQMIGRSDAALSAEELRLRSIYVGKWGGRRVDGGGK